VCLIAQPVVTSIRQIPLPVNGGVTLGCPSKFCRPEPELPEALSQRHAQTAGVDQSRHEPRKQLVGGPNQAVFLPKTRQSRQKLALVGVIRRSSDSWAHQDHGSQKMTGTRYPVREWACPCFHFAWMLYSEYNGGGSTRHAGCEARYPVPGEMARWGTRSHAGPFWGQWLAMTRASSHPALHRSHGCGSGSPGLALKADAAVPSHGCTQPRLYPASRADR